MSESRTEWIVGTLWRVVVAAIVTVILANAVQSFFLDRIIPGVTTGAAGGVSAVVAGLRRKRLATTPKTESIL
jgi:hypothetical protein